MMGEVLLIGLLACLFFGMSSAFNCREISAIGSGRVELLVCSSLLIVFCRRRFKFCAGGGIITRA